MFTKKNGHLWLVLLTTALSASCSKTNSRSSQITSAINTSGAWIAESNWTPQLEREFSRFVAQLGQARALRVCTVLADCLANPKANMLFSSEDVSRKLYADCGDLPYVLRAYFSYKNKLPFRFVSALNPNNVLGASVKPAGYQDFTNYDSFNSLVSNMVRIVYTDMNRMAGDVEGSDTYPIDVNRKTIQPGTVFYDPNGHAGVVIGVDDDGNVSMLDGHPDNSLTTKILGEQYTAGGRWDGGGFRNWRPVQAFLGGPGGLTWSAAQNSALSDLNGEIQYKKNYDIEGKSYKYWDWVRYRLSSHPGTINPINQFRIRTREICLAVKDRIVAVQLAATNHLFSKAHPGLPANIYSTEGDWETYSTPARDARLRSMFVVLNSFIEASVEGVKHHDALYKYDGTAKNLIADYQALLAKGENSLDCAFSYQDSIGTSHGFNFFGLNQRIYDLSFDPYHCPEMRWGAYPARDGKTAHPEFASCAQDLEKEKYYWLEQGLRFVVDRNPDTAPPNVSTAPTSAPNVDVQAHFQRLLVSLGTDVPLPLPVLTLGSQEVLPELDLREAEFAFGSKDSLIKASLRQNRKYRTSEFITIHGSGGKDKLHRFILSKEGIILAKTGIVQNEAPFELKFKLPPGNNQDLVLRSLDLNNEVESLAPLSISVAK